MEILRSESQGADSHLADSGEGFGISLCSMQEVLAIRDRLRVVRLVGLTHGSPKQGRVQNEFGFGVSGFRGAVATSGC